MGNGCNRPALPEGIAQVPDPLRTGFGEFPGENLLGIAAPGIQNWIEAADPNLESAQGLVQGFLKSPANGHDFSHRLHLCGNAVIGVGKFFEGETGDFCHYVIDGWFEGGWGDSAGNLVA